MQIIIFIFILLTPINLGKVKMTQQQKPKIEIYTTTRCPYCVKAKNLLSSKDLDYIEINIEQDPSLKEEMMAKSGGRKTVPQIFINDAHIGGCDDLHATNDSGKLDKIIKGN